VRDGAETAVDCGGSGCGGCGTDVACGVSSDCLSQICAASLCEAPQSSVQAWATISSDFGTGYCATLNVQNIGTAPTTDFVVKLDLHNTTTYSTSGGTYSAATGVAEAKPSTSNRVIQPGAISTKLSFCANRSSSSPAAVPAVLTAVGTF
jgi:hypothetical protein